MLATEEIIVVYQQIWIAGVDMVRLMIRCPVSGNEIFTGIRIEGQRWDQTSDFRAYTRCPICNIDHEWSAKDVQLCAQDHDAHNANTSATSRQRYQVIVDRFERAVRAHLGTLKHVSEICKDVAVSQRTLSRAFRAIRGMTPLAYIHALRLAEVRKALMSADAASANVMEIAMHFGVRELGRFAVEYRAAFGESPSETLRRSPCGRDEPVS